MESITILLSIYCVPETEGSMMVTNLNQIQILPSGSGRSRTANKQRIRGFYRKAEREMG